MKILKYSFFKATDSITPATEMQEGVTCKTISSKDIQNEISYCNAEPMLCVQKHDIS